VGPCFRWRRGAEASVRGAAGRPYRPMAAQETDVQAAEQSGAGVRVRFTRQPQVVLARLRDHGAPVPRRRCKGDPRLRCRCCRAPRPRPPSAWGVTRHRRWRTCLRVRPSAAYGRAGQARQRVRGRSPAALPGPHAAPSATRQAASMRSARASASTLCGAGAACGGGSVPGGVCRAACTWAWRPARANVAKAASRVASPMTWRRPAGRGGHGGAVERPRRCGAAGGGRRRGCGWTTGGWMGRASCLDSIIMMPYAAAATAAGTTTTAAGACGGAYTWSAEGRTTVRMDRRMGGATPSRRAGGADGRGDLSLPGYVYAVTVHGAAAAAAASGRPRPRGGTQKQAAAMYRPIEPF